MVSFESVFIENLSLFTPIFKEFELNIPLPIIGNTKSFFYKLLSMFLFVSKFTLN